MTSRIDSMPTRWCPSTTGRCRTPSSAMRWAATFTSSSGATVTGRSVMYSATIVVAGSAPSASAATRCRSAALGADAADILQLAREALSNVGRHANATTCRVSLHQEDGAVWLEVDDDGRGFDTAAAAGAGRGLGNLRARAARLGGRAEIVSTTGEGTTVRVAIPVERQPGGRQPGG